MGAKHHKTPKSTEYCQGPHCLCEQTEQKTIHSRPLIEPSSLHLDFPCLRISKMPCQNPKTSKFWQDLNYFHEMS